MLYNVLYNSILLHIANDVARILKKKIKIKRINSTPYTHSMDGKVTVQHAFKTTYDAYSMFNIL